MVGFATAYLCLVDRWAIAKGIWEISPRWSLPLRLWQSLPIEEATFFLLTSTMCAWGLTLAMVAGNCAYVECMGKPRMTFWAAMGATHRWGLLETSSGSGDGAASRAGVARPTGAAWAHAGASGEGGGESAEDAARRRRLARRVSIHGACANSLAAAVIAWYTVGHNVGRGWRDSISPAQELLALAGVTCLVGLPPV